MENLNPRERDVPNWRSLVEKTKPTISMAERFRQAQQKQEVPQSHLTTWAEARMQSQEKASAELAPAVALEKAKLLAEFSGKNYKEKIALLNLREKDLAVEERLDNDPINRAVFESYWPKPPNNTEEAWEKSVKARKQAYKEVREGLNSAT